MSAKNGVHKGRFVERNRITSGVSEAIIIGASGKTGGTIHQAEFAEDQNLPRFLYAPDVDDGQSPSKLDDMGFKRFNSVNNLMRMLENKSEYGNKKEQEPTLDDYL